jgi:hypothetical protein
MKHSELTQLRSLLASLLLEHENEIVNDRFVAVKTTFDTVGALIEALYSTPEKNWSVVEIDTDKGHKVGVFENIPEDVETLSEPMTYQEAIEFCEKYCSGNNGLMYEGDCTFIDFTHYKAQTKGDI